jgi:uncharacterized membrane-anchored protein
LRIGGTGSTTRLEIPGHLSSAVRRRSLKPQPKTLNLLNFFQALTVQSALCRNLKTLEGSQTNGRALIWTYILFQSIECGRRPDDTQQRKKKASATVVVVVVVVHPWLVVSFSQLVPPPLLPLFSSIFSSIILSILLYLQDTDDQQLSVAKNIIMRWKPSVFFF